MLMNLQQFNAYGFTPVGGRVCKETDFGKFHLRTELLSSGGKFNISAHPDIYL